MNSRGPQQAMERAFIPCEAALPVLFRLGSVGARWTSGFVRYTPLTTAGGQSTECSQVNKTGGNPGRSYISISLSLIAKRIRPARVSIPSFRITLYL